MVDKIAELKAKLAANEVNPEDMEVVTKVIEGLEGIKEGKVVSQEEAETRLGKRFKG